MPWLICRRIDKECESGRHEYDDDCAEGQEKSTPPSVTGSCAPFRWNSFWGCALVSRALHLGSIGCEVTLGKHARQRVTSGMQSRAYGGRGRCPDNGHTKENERFGALVIHAGGGTSSVQRRLQTTAFTLRLDCRLRTPSLRTRLHERGHPVTADPDRRGDVGSSGCTRGLMPVRRYMGVRKHRGRGQGRMHRHCTTLLTYVDLGCSGPSRGVRHVYPTSSLYRCRQPCSRTAQHLGRLHRSGLPGPGHPYRHRRTR